MNFLNMREKYWMHFWKWYFEKGESWIFIYLDIHKSLVHRNNLNDLNLKSCKEKLNLKSKSEMETQVESCTYLKTSSALCNVCFNNFLLLIGSTLLTWALIRNSLEFFAHQLTISRLNEYLFWKESLKIAPALRIFSRVLIKWCLRYKLKW